MASWPQAITFPIAATLQTTSPAAFAVLALERSVRTIFGGPHPAVHDPVLKLSLNDAKLRNHPLLRRNAPDVEGSAAHEVPTEVGEPQKREGLRFSLVTPLPVSDGEPPEFDQPRLVRMHFQTEPDQPFPKLLQEPLGVSPVLKAHYKVKHPDIFGSLYIMSPCCLSARGSGPANPANQQALEAVKTPADSASLPFGLRAQLASAAAWSPNPKNPPLYLDLPNKSGVVQPDVIAKWATNAPLAFVDQYVGNLRQYRGIAMDVGDQDGLRIDAAKLHDILDTYGIANSFEIYRGTHTSVVADRFQNHVMPFFSKNLCSTNNCR